MIDFDLRKQSIKRALFLGIDVEKNDPAMRDVTNLTDVQVDWIASWLASEGLGAVDTPSPAPHFLEPRKDGTDAYTTHP